jgi:hypothetical protein
MVFKLFRIVDDNFHCPTAMSILGPKAEKRVIRYGNLLEVLKTCEQNVCRHSCHLESNLFAKHLFDLTN